MDLATSPRTAFRGWWIAAALLLVGILSYLEARLGLALLAIALVGSLVVLQHKPAQDVPQTEDHVPASSRVYLLLGLGLLLGADVALFFPYVGVAILLAAALVFIVRITKGELTNVMTIYIVMLFLIPADYSVGPFSVTVARAFALFAFGLWAAAKFLPYARIGRGVTRISLANWLFLFAVLISFIVSTFTAHTAAQERGAMRMLITLGLAAMTAIIISDVARNRRTLHRLLGVAVGAAALMGVIAILEYASVFDPANYPIPGLRVDGELTFIWQRNGFPRVSGTAQHPIEFGVICAVMLPLALYFVYHGQRAAVRSWAIAAAGILAIGIPISLSRSALAAVFVALGFWLLTATGRQRTQIAGLAVSALVVFSLLVPGILGTLVDLTTGEVAGGSLRVREERRSSAWELAEQQLLLGQGIGTYSSSEEREVGIIDNLYLDVLIEQGFVGLIAFLLLIIQSLLVATWLRKRTKDPATRQLLAVFMGGIAGLAVSGWGLSLLNYPMATGVLFLFIGGIGAIERSVAPPALASHMQPEDQVAVSA